ITAGAGTRSITYSAGTGGTLTISVTVKNSFNCSASSTISLTIESSHAELNIWETFATPVWLGSGSLGPNDHRCAEGNSAPVRVILVCAASTWSVTIQYDFKDHNTSRHFVDFLTTYNYSECGTAPVTGNECAGTTSEGPQNCVTGPTTRAISTDSSLPAG